MKQRFFPLRRIFTALMALLILTFTASCAPSDPVVSVGTPSPSATNTATPDDTAAPQTPSARPSLTPSAIMSPGASPDEANGAGAYTIATNVSESQKTYYSEQPDENALRVENSAVAGIDGASVEKRAGEASSLENSIAYGLNAAILVRANAQLLLTNSDVTSVSLGAGGAFARQGRLQLEKSAIRTTGDSSYAVMVGKQGSVTAREANLSTQGARSSALIVGAQSEALMEDGIATTAGVDSPVLSVMGNATVNHATLRANNARAIDVSGGTVSLSDCAVSGRMSDVAGAPAQTPPNCVSLNPGEGELSSFSMVRGALTAQRGDLFYVASTKVSIYLEGVALSLNEGNALLRAVGNADSHAQGSSGLVGAECAIIAKNQNLRGDIITDALSSVSLTLRGETTYTGTINTANTARAAKVTLEDGAVWTLTGNAYLTAFTGHVSSIVTNGFTVFVNGVALTD